MPSLPAVGGCPFRASLFLYRNIPGGEDRFGGPTLGTVVQRKHRNVTAVTQGFQIGKSQDPQGTV